MSAVDSPVTRTTIDAIRAAALPLAMKTMTIAAGGAAAAGLAIRKVIPRRPAAVVDPRAMTMTTIAVVAVVVADGSEIQWAMPRRRVSAGRTMIAAAAAVGRGQAVAMTRMTIMAADAAASRYQAAATTRTTIAADAAPGRGPAAAMMMTAVDAGRAVAAGSVTRKDTPKQHVSAGRMTTAAAGVPDPEPAAVMTKMTVGEAAPAPVDNPVGRAGMAIRKATRERRGVAGVTAIRSLLI
jgi:hypothetical protein